MSQTEADDDTEIDVLKIVTKALRRLPDNDSRQRVVDYAMERAAS